MASAARRPEEISTHNALEFANACSRRMVAYSEGARTGVLRPSLRRGPRHANGRNRLVSRLAESPAGSSNRDLPGLIRPPSPSREHKINYLPSTPPLTAIQ